MKHSPEELEQKIRGMLFLAIRVVNWEKDVSNAGEFNGARKNHLIENIQAMAGSIYNDRGE
jgi:predicted transposase YbfD/YdcC